MGLDVRRKWGIALLVVGLCFVGAGIGLYFGLPVGVNKLVADQRQIYTPSQDQDAYNSFAETSNLNYGYNLFNITNCNDFLAGAAKPVFERVGPYVFNGVQSKINITFSPDATFVSYKEWVNYTYNASASAPYDLNNDLLCSINIGYMSVLAAGDGTENGLVLSLVPAMVKQVGDGLISLVGGIVQSTLVPRACNNATGLPGPVGFGQLYEGVMGELANGLNPLITVNSTNTESFSVQVVQKGLRVFPAQVKSTIFNKINYNGLTAPSPLLLLPSLFLDYFVAEIIYEKTVPASMAVLDATDSALFREFTTDDMRYLLCNHNLSGSHPSSLVCTARATITPSAAYNNLSADALNELLTSIVPTVISGILQGVTGSLSGPLESIGAVQFINMDIIGTPIIITDSSQMPANTGLKGILRPLELGAAVGTNLMQLPNATAALLSFYDLAGPSSLTGEEAFANAVASFGLPSAYGSYLSDWIFTEAALPLLLDVSFGGPGSWTGTPVNEILGTYKEYAAYFYLDNHAQSYQGALDLVSTDSGTTYTATLTLSWTNLGATPVTGNELFLAQAADQSAGLCSKPASDMADATPLNITNYFSPTLGFSTISGSATFTATIPGASLSSMLSSGKKLVVFMTGPNQNATNAYSNPITPGTVYSGFCAPLYETNDLRSFYLSLLDPSPNNTLSLLQATNILGIEFSSGSTIGQLLGEYQSAYGVKTSVMINNTPAVVAIYYALTTLVFQTIFPTSVLSTNSAYLPPQLAPPNPPFGDYFKNLFNIQIGTALVTGGTSIRNEDTTGQFASLLFFPELPIQSVNHTAIPGGFASGATTPFFLSFDKVPALLAVIQNPTNLTSWLANPVAYFTQNDYTTNETIQANQYLQYVVMLTTAAAWVGQKFPQPDNPVAYPPDNLVTALMTGAGPAVNAMLLLESFNVLTTCEAYLNLNGFSSVSTLPFTVDPSQLPAFQSYFMSLDVLVYNNVRKQVGLLAVSNITSGLDDFFFAQMGANIFTSLLGQSITFSYAATAIASGLPLPGLKIPESAVASAMLLNNLLGSRNLEFWAVYQQVPPGGYTCDNKPCPPWTPFKTTIPAFTSFQIITLSAYEARDIWNIMSLPTASLVGMFDVILLCQLNSTAAALELTRLGYTAIGNDPSHVSLIPMYLNYLAIQLGRNLFNNAVLSSEPFAATSNLIVSRTANELINGYLDPLIALADPSAAFVGFNVQKPIQAVQNATTGYVTYYTNGANVGLLHAYNGKTTTTSWKTVQTIDLCSDGTMVPPNHYPNDTINVYLASLDRVFALVSNGSTTTLNIATNRFAINLTDFSPSASVDFSTTGILPLGGVPGTFYHSSLFASLPMPCFANLSAYDPGFTLKNAQENCYPDLFTFIDIEPITGLVFNAKEQLQINAALSPSQFTILNPWLGETTNSTYPAPIFFTDLYNTLTQDQANKFDSTVGAAFEAALILLIVLVALGGLMVIVGVILLILPPRDDMLTGTARLESIEVMDIKTGY